MFQYRDNFEKRLSPYRVSIHAISLQLLLKNKLSIKENNQLDFQ